MPHREGVKYDPITRTLTGKIMEYATEPDASGEYWSGKVPTTLTFPTDDEGHTLEPYRFDYDDSRHKDAYPTENYDDYRSSHSGPTGKLRRAVTFGRTRYGTKSVHNAKYLYRQWYDKLTRTQRRLIGEFNHARYMSGHRARYGDETLATLWTGDDAVTTLRPGHREFEFRM